MTTPARPDWLTEGATVLEHCSYRATVVVTTVERFTKTQVVLTNGQRYRLDRLERSGASSWDGVTRLRPTTDRPARRDLHRQKATARRSAALRVAEPALVRWRREGDDDAARTVIAELAAALEGIADLGPEPTP